MELDPEGNPWMMDDLRTVLSAIYQMNLEWPARGNYTVLYI